MAPHYAQKAGAENILGLHNRFRLRSRNAHQHFQLLTIAKNRYFWPIHRRIREDRLATM